MKNIKLAQSFIDKVKGLKAQLVGKVEGMCLTSIKAALESTGQESQDLALIFPDGALAEIAQLTQPLFQFKSCPFSQPLQADIELCIDLILGSEQSSEVLFTTQLSDNFHNLLLALKQVHLKTTESLVEEAVEITLDLQKDHQTDKMPEWPKASSDAFKHVTKCIGVYCQPAVSNAPMSKEQRDLDYSAKRSKKQELVAVMLNGFLLLCLSCDKMSLNLDLLEQLFTARIKVFHNLLKSQQTYLLQSSAEQKRIVRGHDLILKRVASEFMDGRDKLRQKIQSRLEKYLKQVSDDKSGFFALSLEALKDAERRTVLSEDFL